MTSITQPVASNASLEITANLIYSCKDNKPVPVTQLWGEFRQSLMTPVREGKLSLDEYRNADKDVQRKEKDGLGWIPASLRDQSKGRNLSNIDKVCCIVLDVDGGMTFDEAKNALHGYEAVIHTTYSHTPGEPKLRVVFPLQEPIEADAAASLFEYFQQQFDHKLDSACFEVSRLFYLPACPKGAKEMFRAEHIRGRLLSVEDVISTSLAAAYSGSALIDKASHESKLTAEIATSRSVVVGQRNTMLTKIAGASIGRGDDLDKTMQLCKVFNSTRCCPPLDDAEVERSVKSIAKTAQRKADVQQADLGKAIEAMNAKYAWLTGPMAIYRFSERDTVSKESLRSHYANTSVMTQINGEPKRASHFQAWMSSPDRREHLGLDFVPGAPEIINNHVNLWKAWGAEPIAGNIEPWQKMMDYIFGAGTNERRWAEQWFAYPFQYPGIKLKTAMVIWSVRQGVGKSLLAETVGQLYGRHFKTISSMELHSQYNGWAQESLFILGEENAGNDRRADANKLKQLITGSTLFINEKYRAATECPNRMNFIFTSNHPDAFHLELSDRRFFVWSIDSEPMEATFYDDFVRWRDSAAGRSALLHYLLHVDLAGFDPHGHAPITHAKTEMIEHSKSGLERWLTDALSDEYIDGTIGKEVVSLDELVRLYHRDTDESRTNTTAMGKALRKQAPTKGRRVSTAKGRVSLCTLRNHMAWDSKDSAEWVAEFHKSSPVGI